MAWVPTVIICSIGMFNQLGFAFLLGYPLPPSHLGHSRKLDGSRFVVGKGDFVPVMQQLLLCKHALISYSVHSRSKNVQKQWHSCTFRLLSFIIVQRCYGRTCRHP